MLIVVVDTNCVIDAVTPSAVAFDSLQYILAAHRMGAIKLMMSRHSLSEIHHPDAARQLAEQIDVLPHLPIGAWEEQVSMWNQVQGTWADIAGNDELRVEIGQLANHGTDLRDCGAYLEAMSSCAHYFVTSDKQLVGSGPAQRLTGKFGTKVTDPKRLQVELLQLLKQQLDLHDATNV